LEQLSALILALMFAVPWNVSLDYIKPNIDKDMFIELTC